MGKREHFGSTGAAVLALAGSAIGLGNIWRFPYMVGENGGAAFIILYLIFILAISVPILLCESIIGRSAQSSTFTAMETLAPGTKWKWLGILTVVSPLIILSFYSIVGGWSIGFFFKSIFEGFSIGNTGYFSSMVQDTWMPIIYHTIFLGLTAIIVSAGVKSGIERFNKLSLPVLFVFIILIAAYSLFLPGARDGVTYLLKPDFSRITAKTLANAMGQGFFSLSLGVGTILTYSSYMRREDSILRSGLGTAVFDVMFAIIAGFAVMPAVFAAKIEPTAGPGLIFESLPFVFAKMGAEGLPVISRLISIIFFFTIIVAALTSSISMFEVGVAYLVEEKGVSRRKAVMLLFAGIWALGCICSLFPKVFDFCDKLTSNYLMTFGGLLFVIFVGWKMKKKSVSTELNAPRIFNAFYFFVKYIAPVVIVLIFLTNLFG